MPASEISKLTCHFSFTFPGNIWKIKPDAVTQMLALEVRKTEILQAGFYSVNIQTGKQTLENYQTKERWWTGLEDACNGLLLLHGYEAIKDTGRHLGISAISATDGQLVWEAPELTFSGLLSAESLLAENAEGQLMEVELQTGKKQKYSFTKEHAKTAIKAFEKNRGNALTVPVPYLPADAHYPLLQDFIREKTGKEASQTIEYLEQEEYIFLSFYAETNSILANFLMVCSAQGELLLDICLEPAVAGLGSDTFFIFAEKLFFIQEKKRLLCFLL